MSLIGQTIGQYRILAELGRGQNSVVYKAWQMSLERPVTLKVLYHTSAQPYDRQAGQTAMLKLQAEARLTAQLIQQGVPNIREVYEVGQTADGTLFVAMQFVEGSLRSLLQKKKVNRHLPGKENLMNPEAAARLLQPVAQALDAIHDRGWVHLDVKPQNILITREGRTILADLGISQQRGARTHACTPTYASPEQAAGDRPVGPWSDIYSLGVVLYEMVAGHPPVRGEHDIVLLNQHLESTPPSPRKVNPMLSTSQERAIYKALAKLPQQRHRTAGELIEAMLAPGTPRPHGLRPRGSGPLSSVVETPGRGLATTFGRMRSIPRLALIGGILVLAVILALLAWVLWSQVQPTQMPSTTRTPPALYSPAVSSATSAPATAPEAASRVPTPQPSRTPAPTATLMPSPSP